MVSTTESGLSLNILKETAPVIFISKNLYPYCSVLVGCRNRWAWFKKAELLLLRSH